MIMRRVEDSNEAQKRLETPSNDSSFNRNARSYSSQDASKDENQFYVRSSQSKSKGNDSSLQKHYATKWLPPTTELACTMGRLEIVNVKDDLYGLMRNHPGVTQDFLGKVVKELEKCVAKCPKRRLTSEAYLGPLKMVTEDCSRIPQTFFFDPANAWPMEVLFLICQFYVKTEHMSESIFAFYEGEGHRYNEKRSYANVTKGLERTGIATVGKGTLAAIAISMCSSTDALASVAAEIYLIAHDVGMAHRTIFRRVYPDTLKESCAIMVFGLSLITINLVLEHINKGSTLGGKFYNPVSWLEVTTIYTTRCFVVSGHPLDLSRLKVMLEKLQQNAGIRILYREVHLYGPQNHNTLNHAVYHELLSRWQYYGVELDPKLLKIKVFSPTTGETWDENWKSNLFANFLQELSFAITTSHHILHYGLQVLLHDRSFLLPISGDYFNLGHLIAWDRKLNLNGYCRHPLLFTPKLETDAKNILKCMRKVAIMNKFWREVSPSSKVILNTNTSLSALENDGFTKENAGKEDTERDDTEYDIEEKEVLTPSVLSLTPRSPRHQQCHSDSDTPSSPNPRINAFMDKIHEETGVEMKYLRCLPNTSVLLQIWTAVEYIKE